MTGSKEKCSNCQKWTNWMNRRNLLHAFPCIYVYTFQHFQMGPMLARWTLISGYTVYTRATHTLHSFNDNHSFHAKCSQRSSGHIWNPAKNVKPHHLQRTFPNSKVHEANRRPTWVLSAPDGPHVGPMNLAIRVMVGEVWQLSEDDIKLPADHHYICTQLWLDGLDNMIKFIHHCYGMIIMCYNHGTNLLTFAPGHTVQFWLFFMLSYHMHCAW